MTYTSQFKTKPQLYINEANVFPEEYLKDIEKKIDNLQLYKINNNKKNVVKIICDKLNQKFILNNIKFIYQTQIDNNAYEDYIKYGINSGATLPDRKAKIDVFINPLIVGIIDNIKFEEEFKKHLLFILKHELIHRGQHLRVHNVKLRAEVHNKEYENQIKYLSDKQEIMARAWEIVELFKLRNYSIEEIKNILKSNDIRLKYTVHPLRVYLDWFDKDSNVIKLLYKYMYGYLEK